MKLVGWLGLAIVSAMSTPQFRSTNGARELSCPPRCRVSIDTVATLRVGRAVESEPVERSTVVRLPNGKFFVSPVATEGQLAVFSSNGVFERSIGRMGAGPGEFFRISTIVALDSSLAVFEGGSRRLTLLGSAGGIAGRSAFPLVPNYNEVLSTGDGWIVSATVRSPERFGLLFHEVDRDGNYVRSFGTAGPYQDTPNGRLPVRRAVAWSSRGTLFSIPMQGYTLEEWSRDGRLLRSIVMPRDWANGAMDAKGRGEVDLSRAVSLQAGPSGTIIVKILRPKVGKDQMKRRGREVSYAGMSQSDLYDTLIEVIDERDGRLLASKILSGYATGPSSSGHWSMLIESETGEVTTIVFRVSAK